MGRFSIFILMAIALAMIACSTPGVDSAESEPAIDSVFTFVDRASCEQKVDVTDPNETPYLSCPGVAGYSLIVRTVGSGRKSVDIVDPSQEVHPLRYDEFVTPHMSNLAGRAEWRVATIDGQQTPVSVIVPVEAREDLDDPEAVTNTYLAVAKITAAEICVTDRIPQKDVTAEQIHSVADSARNRACASPQPPITPNGQPLP